MTDKVKFGQGNAKLSVSIATFSLPAGHSCPFARECKSQTDLLTGKVIDGQHCRFRCFAATNEARATNVRKQRWHNFNILKDARKVEKTAEILQASLPLDMEKVRVHVSGDFFTEQYFLAWVNVAMSNPLNTFYGYTKALPFLVKYGKYLPNNFRFTASRGGTHDHLIDEYGLVSAEVVFSVEEAQAKGLEIDHDDSHAIRNDKSFALLLHGTQPPGTAASKAWVKIMNSGIGGYGGNSDFRKAEPARPVSVYITLRDGEIFLPKQVSRMGKKANSRKLVYA